MRSFLEPYDRPIRVGDPTATGEAKTGRDVLGIGIGSLLDHLLSAQTRREELEDVACLPGSAAPNAGSRTALL
jgi:hypothetical protein